MCTGFVLLIFKIRCMKNNTPTQGISLSAVLKFLGQALKNFFQSSTNREFKRLKDFISS